MPRSTESMPCQPSKFIDIYIYDTSFLRALFHCLVFAFIGERPDNWRGKQAALMLDLLAQHTEEQANHQTEDIDKETKFIWNH